MHPLFDQRRYLIPFRSSLLPQIFTDTLVIGTGVAGLRAAIAAAGTPTLRGGSGTPTLRGGSDQTRDGVAGYPGGDVIILSKDGTEESNTAWAQGGIAAVMSREDSIESHVQDTLTAGGGLCDEPAVRAICAAAPERMRELAAWGMRFDQRASRVSERGAAAGEDKTGDHLSLNREGGHAHARILHADGDATGKELVRCLVAKLAATPHVRLFTNCFSLDLITPSGEPGAPVMGAITHHPRYGLQMIWAKSTILATGGAGMVFRETTNPRCATADGLAMAYRAGAAVQDLAFVQFHPTTLYLAGRPRSLITEAVRGAGAFLVDHSGARFMVDVHPMAELAPRDVVSRAIVHRLATHGGTHVFLDVRHIQNFAGCFPGIAALLKGVDLDPTKDLIPVNPAAHYTVGGVATDMNGRTNVPGLFAVGEVASCGLHGANRLASNSLLEGLVLGEAAGRSAAAIARASHAPVGSPGDHDAATLVWSDADLSGRTIPFRPPPAPVPVISDIRPSDNAELDLSDVLSSLRSAMWRNAGVERSGPRLADVAEMIDFWARYTLDKIFDSPPGWQAQNMLLAAALIARSALWRAESRGGHVRMDCPETLEAFHVHDRTRRAQPEPTRVPVNASNIQSTR
ncbi:MAG TPA: FAD-binding protein [Phycisphaerales bacterium]|nr:FAD-binding protein [Phycisphaerales bacterium]